MWPSTAGCVALHCRLRGAPPLASCMQEAKDTACSELLLLARRLWGDSACVVRQGSCECGVALQTSALDIVVAGIPSLPQPDNPDGSGYLPPTRHVVAEHLKALEQCAPPACAACPAPAAPTLAVLPVLPVLPLLRQSCLCQSAPVTAKPSGNAPLLHQWVRWQV